MKRALVIFLMLTFGGCKKEKVEEIIIGETLLNHQSLFENQKLEILICQSLKKDKNSIIALKNFPNGGAGSAYDLGYILTQIIYKMGEDDFASVLREIPKSERNEIEGLIAVGLEYGNNDYNGKIDNEKLKSEFPILYKILKKD